MTRFKFDTCGCAFDIPDAEAWETGLGVVADSTCAHHRHFATAREQFLHVYKEENVQKNEALNYLVAQMPELVDPAQTQKPYSLRVGVSHYFAFDDARVLQVGFAGITDAEFDALVGHVASFNAVNDRAVQAVRV
jgi:hypothetical protein